MLVFVLITPQVFRTALEKSKYKQLLLYMNLALCFFIRKYGFGLREFLETYLLISVEYFSYSYGNRQPPSRKSFQNQEKICNPQNISESKKKIMKSRKTLRNREKKLKSGKIFRNQENNFRIEKNISESRKLFQNQEIFCQKNREKIFGIECYYNIFA